MGLGIVAQARTDDDVKGVLENARRRRHSREYTTTAITVRDLAWNLGGPEGTIAGVMMNTLRAQTPSRNFLCGSQPAAQHAATAAATMAFSQSSHCIQR